MKALVLGPYLAGDFLLRVCPQHRMRAALSRKDHHSGVAVEQGAWREMHALPHLNALYTADVAVCAQRSDDDELIRCHISLHAVAGLVHDTTDLCTAASSTTVVY